MAVCTVLLGEGCLMRVFISFSWFKYQLLLVFLCINGVFALPHQEKRGHVRQKEASRSDVKMVFVDGGVRTKNHYFQTFGVFEKLGWKSSFYNVEDLLSLGGHKVCEKNPQISCFVLGMDFWRGKRGGYAKQRICEAINQSLGVEDGVTLLSVPDSLGKQGALLSVLLDNFFQDIGFEEFSGVASSEGMGLWEFTEKLKSFLSSPLSSRSIRYDTALRAGAVGHGLAHVSSVFHTNVAGDIALTLPSNYPGRFSAQSHLASLLPMGFLLFSNARRHSVIFFPESLLKTCGFAEDFHIFPVDAHLQKDFEKMTQALWVDIDSWARYSGPLWRVKIDEMFKSGALRSALSVEVDVPMVDTFGAEKKVLTGWMELVAFERTPGEITSIWQEKCRRQKELIDDILSGGLTYLWISLSPQMYYGVHAKCPEKKTAFEAGFKRFARMLRARAKARHHEKIPQLFIGFEIANNLYERHLPAEYAVDLFGTPYTDMPAPTSRLFWQEEIVDPFRYFMSFMRTLPAENSLPIAGVIFDLELYGRRHEGEFLSTMVCDDQTRNAFLAARKLGVMTSEKFVEWLSEKKMWEAYERFVEKKVEALAAKMRKDLVRFSGGRKLLFSVYTPSISIDSFYKNFFKGLMGGQVDALHWFSFNTNFARLRKFVEHEFAGTKIEHSSVVMLSKVTDDLNRTSRFIQNILKYNHGAWFNRWSRMPDPHEPNEWHISEQPHMFDPVSKPKFTSLLSEIMVY